MPQKLRVLAQNSRHEKQMESEISSSLASVLKTNPKMNIQDAMLSVTNTMLINNPFQPPKDGKCPINDLPDELLGYIFSVGVKQELEDEADGYDSEDDGDFGAVDFDDEDEDASEKGSSGDAPDAGAEAIEVDEDSGNESDSDSDMFEDDDVRIPFQVLASHVCKRWRDVALDSHVLWTTLDFAKRPNLELARMYISRAQGLPLSICIDCTFPEHIDEEDHPDHPLYSENRKQAREAAHHEECGDPHCHDGEEDELRFLSQQELTSILDLLEPEVNHWGSLEFRASTYGYVHLLLSRLHKLPAAPMLQSFQMYHFEDCEDYEFFSGDDKTAFLPFQGNAPMLKEAIFWGVHIDWDASVASFLSGLREFELSFHAKDVRPSYATFEQIIKSSPDLHTLTLSLSGPALPNEVEFDAPREEGGWGPTPLAIPSLKEFAIQFHDVRYASALVQHLDMPNVTGLLLNFDEEDYTEFVRTLLKPVQGRTEGLLHHVDHLKISGLPCNVATTDLFLEQLANLKSLNIKVVGQEEAIIFEKLINPARTAPPDDDDDLPDTPGAAAGAQSSAGFKLPALFCPKLETLTTNQVDAERIREVVAARKALGAPLSRVFMSTTDEISEVQERWLRANLTSLEFFDPSDSEEDDIAFFGEDGEDDEGWETEEDADEDGDEDDDEDDGDEPPLISPLARHLGRGARRRGRMDVD